MKKLIALLMLLAIASSASVCLAEMSTTTVGVEAFIQPRLELSGWIRSAPPKVDPYGEGSGSALNLDFGPLEFDSEYHVCTATKYFTVFLMATSSGRPYRIEQTNTGFSFGTTDLNNSLIMTPDYQTKDEIITGKPQGSMPSGDSFGTAGLAFGDNKVIYNGNSGKARIARAYYGLSTGDADNEPAGAEPITGDQLTGTYSGTILFSVVLQQ